MNENKNNGNPIGNELTSVEEMRRRIDFVGRKREHGAIPMRRTRSPRFADGEPNRERTHGPRSHRGEGRGMLRRTKEEISSRLTKENVVGSLVVGAIVLAPTIDSLADSGVDKHNSKQLQNELNHQDTYGFPDLEDPQATVVAVDVPPVPPNTIP